MRCALTCFWAYPVWFRPHPLMLHVWNIFGVSWHFQRTFWELTHAGRTNRAIYQTVPVTKLYSSLSILDNFIEIWNNNGFFGVLFVFCFIMICTHYYSEHKRVKNIHSDAKIPSFPHEGTVRQLYGSSYNLKDSKKYVPKCQLPLSKSV